MTFELALVTWASGLTLGAILGVASHRWPGIGAPLRVIAFILSGVPFLVLLYWAHFPLQELFDVVVDPFVTACVVLSALNIAGVAQVWRQALDDFRSEYVVAGQVCGMSRWQIARYVQVPLLLRQVIPTLLVIQIVMLQSTLFASLISVEEIFRVSQRINSIVHRPIEIYTSLAFLFLVICVPANVLAWYLRKRLTRDMSER